MSWENVPDRELPPHLAEIANRVMKTISHGESPTVYYVTLICRMFAEIEKLRLDNPPKA